MTALNQPCFFSFVLFTTTGYDPKTEKLDQNSIGSAALMQVVWNGHNSIVKRIRSTVSQLNCAHYRQLYPTSVCSENKWEGHWFHWPLLVDCGVWIVEEQSRRMLLELGELMLFLHPGFNSPNLTINSGKTGLMIPVIGRRKEVLFELVKLESHFCVWLARARLPSESVSLDLREDER